MVHNPLVTADRSTLCNFTAVREHSRSSVSMGRIDQSHAQKVSGVTTSIHFVISLPGTGSWPGGWGPLPKACCALGFDPVLDIRISRKHNVWNVFRTAQKWNGSSYTRKWQLNFQARSLNSEMTITFPDETCCVVIHTHGKHISCLSDNWKTKNKWKVFAMTLLPF